MIIFKKLFNGMIRSPLIRRSTVAPTIRNQAASVTSVSVQTNMENFWMPFTNNRSYKQNPKLFSRSQGIYYYTPEGREVIDGMSGIWCSNAGHGQPKIIEAIKKQVTSWLFNAFLLPIAFSLIYHLMPN